jgi:hypothetical protein
MKLVLLGHSLYPHRVHFFVEGATEEVVVKGLLEALFGELDAAGFQVTNPEGATALERRRTLVESAGSHAAGVALIFDKEGTVERDVEELDRLNLIDAEQDPVLWTKGDRPSSFEEANYTPAELLAFIARAGKKRNPGRGALVDGPRVQRGLADRTRDEGDKARAMATVMLKMAENPQYGSVRLSKKELGAEILANLLRSVRIRGSLQQAADRRPILQFISRQLERSR